MGNDTIDGHIRSGKFANFYFLYGEENYLKAHYCNRIIAKCVAKGTESFNLHTFDSLNFDEQKIAAAVSNLPLMSEHKCVLLHDVDPHVLNAGQWKSLQEILKGIPPECIVLYCLDAVEFDKSNSRFKWLASFAQKHGVCANVMKLSKPELRALLKKRVIKNGCSINPDTIDYLVDVCGYDLNTLGCETDKICAYTGSGEVTRDDIDKVAVKSLESSVFNLAGTIIDGRLGEGISLLDRLLYNKEDPVAILAVFSSTFRDLYRAKIALMSGAGQKEIATDFAYGNREFLVRRAFGTCRKTPLKFLRGSLILLMKADERLKSSRTDKQIILEQLLVEINELGKRCAG